MVADLASAISERSTEIFDLLDEVNGGLATLDRLKKEPSLAFKVTEQEAVQLDLPGRISKEFVSGKSGTENISLRLVEINRQPGEACEIYAFSS